MHGMDIPEYGFQSTPPVKAATVYLRYILNCEVISIHAAREGGDAVRMESIRVC